MRYSLTTLMMVVVIGPILLALGAEGLKAATTYGSFDPRPALFELLALVVASAVWADCRLVRRETRPVPQGERITPLTKAQTVGIAILIVAAWYALFFALV